MVLADTTSLLSGRAQERLAQLYRALTGEVRALTTQQSLLLGALQACDKGTQQMLLSEYAERVDAVLAAVTLLRSFVERQTKSTVAAPQPMLDSLDHS